MGAIKKIVRNCRQATLLIEKQTTDKLTVKEFLSLRLHLLFCSVCRLFKKQSAAINKMMINLIKAAETNAPKLDDAYKTSLQQQIDEKLNK
jgi:predicted anti-sigma-YlaC factor YlaD